jgi:hypothetical protein
MRTFACVSLLASLGALGACSARGLTIGGDGVRDLSVITTNNPDLANDGCMQMATWPSASGFPLMAYFTPEDGGEGIDDSTMEAFNQAANGNYNILVAEVDVPPGIPPAYPATVTFSSQTTFEQPVPFGANGASEASVYAYVNCDINSGCANGDLEEYVAQGGTLTMTQVDDSPNGTMAVTATNLHLLQWPTDTSAPDQPIPGGKCLDVASFTGSVAYAPQSQIDFGAPIDFATPVDLATRD